MRYGIHISPAPLPSVINQAVLAKIMSLLIEARETNKEIVKNLNGLQEADENLARELKIVAGRVHSFVGMNSGTLEELKEHLNRKTENLAEGKMAIVFVERPLWARVKMWFGKFWKR